MAARTAAKRGGYGNGATLGGLGVIMGGMFLIPQYLPKRLENARDEQAQKLEEVVAVEGVGAMAETTDARRVRFAYSDEEAAGSTRMSNKAGQQVLADSAKMPGWLVQRDAGEQPTLDKVLEANDKRNDVLMRFVRPDEGFVWPFMRGSGRWGHGGWAVGRGQGADDGGRVRGTDCRTAGMRRADEAAADAAGANAAYVCRPLFYLHASMPRFVLTSGALFFRTVTH